MLENNKIEPSKFIEYYIDSRILQLIKLVIRCEQNQVIFRHMRTLQVYLLISNSSLRMYSGKTEIKNKKMKLSDIQLNQESRENHDKMTAIKQDQKKANYRTKSYCHTTSMALGRKEWISKTSCNDYKLNYINNISPAPAPEDRR